MEHNSVSSKRLMKEAGETRANYFHGISIKINPENLYKWDATSAGPEGTPYKGGQFHFEIKFNYGYPLAPPKVRCLTRTFHCNINTQGDICLDLLKEKLTPLLTVQSILLSIQQLLSEPNPGK